MDHDQTTDELDPERGGEGRTAVAEPALITPGCRLGQRYLLDRRLGHGGMSVVWLATDERLGRPVAIKVLSEALTAEAQYLDRFRREAKVAAGLQHPNLVSVYDFSAGSRPYLVMEYIEGGDLARRVARGETPTAERLARELLGALAHIHAAGVLHRDIKPQNVLIDANGHARLTDFGIAQPRDAASLTRTGQVVGTEAYLAPEVKSGEPASERSDLYGLGVLLANIAREGAGAPLWTLTDRLQARAPEARPPSAAAALAELEEAGPPALAGEVTQPFQITAAEDVDPREPPAEPADIRGPFEPTGIGSRAATRRWRLRIGVVIAALLTAAVAALVIVSAGDSGDGGGGGAGASKATRASDSGQGSKNAKDNGSGGSGSSSAEPSTTAETTAPPTESSTAPQTTADTGGGAVDGASLNDQGFALVEQGSYEEAIPVLQQAVDALRSSGDEQTYNYALYNLGSAYVGAGRYDEAIPVLEERMQYDDGQLDTVQATLDEALSGAGQAPTGGTETKPGNAAPPGQTGGVPPGQQDD